MPEDREHISNALAYLEFYFKEDEGKDNKTANLAWDTVKQFIEQYIRWRTF